MDEEQKKKQQIADYTSLLNQEASKHQQARKQSPKTPPDEDLDAMRSRHRVEMEQEYSPALEMAELVHAYGKGGPEALDAAINAMFERQKRLGVRSHEAPEE